jgi:hypothetical protein
MNTSVRGLLMGTDAEFCVIPQAWDGMASVEDTMDAEYQWLDATAEITGYKYRKGTMQVEAIIIKVDYDFTLPELEVY